MISYVVIHSMSNDLNVFYDKIDFGTKLFKESYQYLDSI